jgi:acetyl-CoA carboxylase carboxyltransferase component/pyruvate/2-oxoglutarate dehydrogenase complex dihydrolipoamide acyltransferase (E2) component
MPAVLVALPVVVGQEVDAGDPVARIESMKVETVVTAPVAGIVRELLAAVNGQVDAGAPLIRLQPLGERPATAPPLALSTKSDEATKLAPRERYLAALTDLRRLLLGFDSAAAAAKKLATAWRDVAAAVPGEDAEVLLAEDGALAIFAELEWLFTRARRRDGGRGKPPLEELWRYLHEPEAHGSGLSVPFTGVLRRALSHYGVSMEAPGRQLELALLRIQKAHERVDAHLGPLLGILERRLATGGVPSGLSGPGSRDLLDHLIDVGQERFPGLADLARELRYRRFDQPAFDAVRQAVYTQAEADLAQLATAPAGEVERLVERLVECQQPIATMLVSRMATGPAALRPRVVESLLRRYYRLRPLGPIAAIETDGMPSASADYQRDGLAYRVVACHTTLAQAAKAAQRLVKLASETPAERQLVIELYLWQEGAALADDAQAEALVALLARAGFDRPVLRVSVVLATAGRGLGNQESQQHFTLRGGKEGFSEDRRYRGVHFMMFQRMQLDRLSKFDLERLPSAEDVYLYRGVAQGNAKDERLFGAAEVRDVTPVRDAEGRVVQLPHLERRFQEALAGMRRFQAKRPANQRLEWNRVLLTVGPPLTLSRDEVRALAQRLIPSAEGLGLEMVLIHARIPDATSGKLVETLLRIVGTGEDDLSIRWDAPADKPLEPMAEYQQKVVQLRRRGLTHPFELVKMLAPPKGSEAGLPPGEFVEYDLDATGKPVVVKRPPGQNSANIVMGVITSYTARHPEGMKRVILLGDPGREMGSVAEPECRRIYAALELAEQLKVPLEWFEVCAGAKISMTTGTENMDWVSAVLRKIIEFTQAGGEINVLVLAITVGAQPYWNAEATMLMHTRGILVMIPGASMVLTGKQALEYSGSVSAEDNEGIGGYDRIMGPNGQAQYQAASLADACQILMRHYDHCYLAPGERFPRRAPTTDPVDRDVRNSPHGPEGGAGFVTVGDVFSKVKNPDRKKPFEIRKIMAACIDQDHEPLERWRDVRGGETGVVWDAHLGGWPVCLLGIQSRPLPRLEFVPADGPEFWSAGTLFPQSSKKIARAVNASSGNRPLVVLANLSGFDGSPESMRRLQLEYGAEIGRAVVNFKGPIVFCVVSRYHGGAFVVFAKTLKEELTVVAVEGARASVIGGAPAAAVVFAREVDTRTRKDPRVVEAEKAAAQGGAARGRLAEVVAEVRSEKLGEVGDEFDKVHSVERALQVGSLDQILSPAELRPWLISAVERGIARHLKGK